MSEKKEIIEYLRNQQKAVEIEAKINGVNFWVLLAAMAVISFQSIGIIESALWSSPEILIRVIVMTQAIYMLSWLLKRAKSAGSEIRYASISPDDIESPFLVVFEGALIAMPSLILITLFNRDLIVLVMIVLGGVYMGLGITSIFRRIVGISKDPEKLPAPHFGSGKRGEAIMSLVFVFIFSMVLYKQMAYIGGLPKNWQIEEVKYLSLLSALCFLVHLAVKRKFHSDSIAWTYELETELALGLIAPEVAIRRIEHRYLGPRLQDVMDNFFNDLDVRFEKFDFGMIEFKERLKEVECIPIEYSAERTSRLKEASHKILSDIELIVSDCDDFTDYLNKLESKNIGTAKALLTPVLSNLKARHKSYVQRAAVATKGLKALLSEELKIQ